MVENHSVNKRDSETRLDFRGTDSGSTVLMVRMIQQSRNEEPCFASDKRHDCAEGCEWRRDCRKLMAAWLRHWLWTT